MDAQASTELSRRERQIVDIAYRRGRATAADVLADLPDPPTYSAVRAALRLLEESRPSPEELDRLAELIEQARTAERGP